MKPTADPTGWEYDDAPSVAQGETPTTVAEWSDADRCWYLTTTYPTPSAPDAQFQYRVRLRGGRSQPVGVARYE